jgi:dolichyl-phosphate beta-glucosyltransferase
MLKYLKQMELSVIIPAKNEERNIRKTVESVFFYCSTNSISHEIIVVVNNSTDKTVATIKELMARIPSIKLIEFNAEAHKASKGLAVKKGMLQATGNYRVFMDADNSTTIDNLETMMPYFKLGYQVIIASIAIKGAKVASGSEPIWRRLFGKLGNFYIQIFAVPGIWDTQRGFKVLTAEAADKIFSHLTIFGWGFDVEMLALARKFGYKIREIPIDWHNDPNSRVSLKSYLQVLLETLLVRWNLVTGRYN